MKYLDNKVLIYIQSGHGGEIRFYNRSTQGFTARFTDGQFSDTTGASIKVYYNSWRRHPESLKTWQAMAENDCALTYTATTYKDL